MGQDRRLCFIFQFKACNSMRLVPSVLWVNYFYYAVHVTETWCISSCLVAHGSGELMNCGLQVGASLA
jgi:hypothetical protein